MDGTELKAAEPNAALTSAIEAAVRATPGVRSLYRSGSLISNAIGAGAVALGVQTIDDQTLISVRQGDLGVSVTASIGIDFTRTAADTLRDAHGAIDALLTSHGVLRERITLTIVYVQSREAS